MNCIGWPYSSSGGWSPATHRGGPVSNPGQVIWDLRWTKQHWGSYSTLHSSWSIIRGWYNRPNGGRRAKWTQSHSILRGKKTVLVRYEIWKPWIAKNTEKSSTSTCKYDTFIGCTGERKGKFWSGRNSSRDSNPEFNKEECQLKLKTKLRGLSLRANYTDRATAARRPS
jgi:hypothetical protein